MVRRLDGLPLAIELAAGRLSSLGLTDLGRRLDRALDVLQGVTVDDERHGTLRAAIAWSYDLLSEPEQRLFRHLAVFPDGVELDTAEEIGRRVAPTLDATAAVAHLADASMLIVSFGDRHRYRMLDMLRSFGLDCLVAAGEHDDAVAWLLEWALDVARTIDAGLFTEAEPAAAATLVAEFANIRAAWTTARATGRIDEAAALVVLL
jgi:predicted ATPase